MGGRTCSDFSQTRVSCGYAKVKRRDAVERATGSTSAAHAAMITHTRCIAPGSFVLSSLRCCRYSLLSGTMLEQGRRTEKDDMDQHTEVILAIPRVARDHRRQPAARSLTLTSMCFFFQKRHPGRLAPFGSHSIYLYSILHLKSNYKGPLVHQ